MAIQDIFKEGAHINDLSNVDLAHMIEVCAEELHRRGSGIEKINEEFIEQLKQARLDSGWGPLIGNQIEY